MGKLFQVAKEKLEFLVDEWVHRLGMGGWDWNIVYFGTPCIGSPDTVARINSSFAYEYGNLEFFLPVAEKSDDDYLEYAVVHELCHAMVNQMSRCSTKPHHVDNEEIVVTRLAKALIRVKYSSKSLAKK